jgi:hypothetical protein
MSDVREPFTLTVNGITFHLNGKTLEDAGVFA